MGVVCGDSLVSSVLIVSEYQLKVSEQVFPRIPSSSSPWDCRDSRDSGLSVRTIRTIRDGLAKETTGRGGGVGSGRGSGSGE